MPADSFLSRWSKRKQESRKEEAKSAATVADVPARSVLVAPPAALPSADKEPMLAPAAEPPANEDVTSADPLPPVESLTPESDFRPFMKPDVDPALRNQAMKSLFRDPHFNVMDRLDIYIDDYSLPDPIPESMLRQMTQSKMLKLFDDPTENAEAEPQVSADATPDDGTPEPGQGVAHAPDAQSTAPAQPEAAASEPELGQNGPDKTNCLTEVELVENPPQHRPIQSP